MREGARLATGRLCAVTDEIGTIALRAPRWAGSSAFVVAAVARRHARDRVAIAYTIAPASASGATTSRSLGVRDHQLRLVDRHRPRGHVHLGDPVPVRADVAHVDQSLRRGDDDLRGRCRRRSFRCSTSAGRGSPTGCSRYPNPMGVWPQLQERAAVGRRRGDDVLHGLAAVLVPRPDPRPRDAARPREDAAASASSTGSSRSAGAARRGTGSTTSART